ncbi:Potassium voltage-gated channel subfamily KQT member 5 [Phytophthora citrophthora]|uniref:Potassium voltage-gated channel subfamily KQT member 5 n=1 Tax=Phytophthora citrophthora TaxID=4793 RepID=A0AAD9GG62_9STRA|nr:Potassium voltage-gated channel subfamily KQT member 5 [Phytophthora citrophthora]
MKMKNPCEQRPRSLTEHSALLSTPSSGRWRRPHRRNTTLRQDIWTVLRFRSSVQHRYGLQLASYVLELSVLTLILLNVVVAVSESSALLDVDATDSSSGPKPVINNWTDMFLLVSTIIFSIEYALRLWSCVEDDRYNNGAVRGRLKWMTRPLSLIDLLALVPFYLELSMEFDAHQHGGLTLRSLRLLRIVSFLRLERMYNAMKNLRVIFARKKEELLVVTYLTALVVLTSSLLIFFLEHLAQPSVFSNFGVCIWWSVETITSLGYGDVVPATSLGRLLGASLALWGIVLFTIPGAVLGSGFIEVMLEKQREEEAEMYSMAMGGGSINSNNPIYVGSFSDDEQVNGQCHTAAAHTPMSMTSPNSPPTPHLATAFMRIEALHQNVETIAAGQRHLEAQFQKQQQQLERLTQLLEAALGVATATNGASTPQVCLLRSSPAVKEIANMLLARLRTVAVTRNFQTRGFVSMLGSATSKTEKAAAQAAEAAQPQERGDIVLDGFAKRQFDDKTYSGTQLDFDKTEFVNKVNEIYESNNKQLVDGYAPFCKHLFIKNFTGARLNMVPITQANAHMLMSDYEARTEYELPVLGRWFPSHSVTPRVAEYLDIILYSREQIIKENEAVDVPADPSHGDSPWGIVSIKAQDVDYELPMKPITMMRNAVGKEQGGSGVPIDRDEYMKAVEYWRNHAVIKKM